MDLRDKPAYPFSLDFVGLSPRTPLTSCTHFYSAGELRRVRRSGDSTPGRIDNMRYIEIRTPEHMGHVALHYHEFYEIALFRSGKLQHVLLDDQHTVVPGDVLILPPKVVHGYVDRGAGCYTDIYLLPDWLQEELRILWGAGGLVQFLLAHALFDNLSITPSYLWLHCSPEETAAWEQELQAIDREYKGSNPSNITINGCFLKILGILDKVYMRQEHQQRLPIRREAWKAAAEIERYVARAIPFSPEALAAHVSMSTRNLGRVFRETVGRTPFDYYQRRRIAHARRLLLEPTPSITTIAHELGFSDAAHFSRLFKQSEGMSPRTFRQRGKGNQPGG